MSEPRNVFSGPIFQDVPDDIDETWHWGIIFGGMVSSNLLIARSYKEAADRLVDGALRDDDVYEVGWPVFFLYRHAIELYLKEIVRPKELHHRLLVDEFLEVVRARFRQELPGWVVARLREFAEWDPGSFAFRYAHGRKGGITFPEESWADLLQARKVVDELTGVFERAMERE